VSNCNKMKKKEHCTSHLLQ